MASEILAAWPGMEAAPAALEDGVLTTGIANEVPMLVL